MKKGLTCLIPICLVILSCAAFFLVAEGVYSVTRGSIPSSSLSHQIFTIFKGGDEVQKIETPNSSNARLLRSNPAVDDTGPDLGRSGTEQGNVLYRELKTELAGIHHAVAGCERQKPNLRNARAHIVTPLFDPVGPILEFAGEGDDVSPSVEEVSGQDQIKILHLTTNEFGDRITLPKVRADKKVYVVGGSIANGVLLEDGETISSQLQEHDPERRYINTGIGGVDPSDQFCALERAAENYGGTVDEVIYIYSEADFDPHLPYGTPGEIMEWLGDFSSKHGGIRVRIVFSPYIYNVIPQLTRIEGYPGHDFPRHSLERGQVAESARKHGFDFIDYTKIALEENEAAGTAFAAFALYVDAAHLSKYGTEKLVERLRLQE